MPYITKLELNAIKYQVEKTLTEQIAALLINSYFVLGPPINNIVPGGDVFLKINAGACVMHLPSARFIEITELVAATPKGHVVKPVKLSVEVRFF